MKKQIICINVVYKLFHNNLRFNINVSWIFFNFEMELYEAN